MIKLIKYINTYKKYFLLGLIVIMIIIGIIINNVPSKKVISENIEPIESNKGLNVDLKGEIVNPNKYYFQKPLYLFEIIEIAGGFTKYASLEGLNLIEKIDCDSEIVINKSDNKKSITINIIDYSTTSNYSYLYIENTMNIYKFDKNKSFEEIFWILNLDNKNYNINLNEFIKEDIMLCKGDSLLNINKASFDDLKKLNVLSETIINNILLYIKENRRINDFEELDNINGIGEKTINKLKGLICFN